LRRCCVSVLNEGMDSEGENSWNFVFMHLNHLPFLSLSLLPSLSLCLCVTLTHTHTQTHTLTHTPHTHTHPHTQTHTLTLIVSRPISYLCLTAQLASGSSQCFTQCKMTFFFLTTTNLRANTKN